MSGIELPNGRVISREDATYIAGFTDGEGCFMVSPRKNRSGAVSHRCVFTIQLRFDDEPILRFIHESLGIGTLRFMSPPSRRGKPPVAMFNVSARDDCMVLDALFKAVPLRAKKRVDFDLWSRALDAWKRTITGRGAFGGTNAALWDEMEFFGGYLREHRKLSWIGAMV